MNYASKSPTVISK